jgi:hypothetical protein
MVGLYNLIADYKTDTTMIFSDLFDIPTPNIKVTLRSTDISAQIIVDSGDIRKQCGRKVSSEITSLPTKIIFRVNRLDEYETFDSIHSVLLPLSSMIKIKDRYKKIKKIQGDIL